MPATQSESSSRGGLFAEALVDIDVLKSDSANLPIAPRAFMVNQAGTVKISDVYDNAFTLTVLAGVVYPIRLTRVWSTGTSATGIIGLI